MCASNISVEKIPLAVIGVREIDKTFNQLKACDTANKDY